MAKSTKSTRSSVTGRFVTRPLGKAKAERFNAVEGLTKSEETKSLAGRLRSKGLKGDAYRKGVMKAYKKA